MLEEPQQDNIFAATIPATAFNPGYMIRWYITASDTQNNSSRIPFIPASVQSDEYFGTVVTDPDLLTQMPVIHWFLAPGTESAATPVDKSANSSRPGNDRTEGNRQGSPATIPNRGCVGRGLSVLPRGSTDSDAASGTHRTFCPLDTPQSRTLGSVHRHRPHSISGFGGRDHYGRDAEGLDGSSRGGRTDCRG